MSDGVVLGFFRGCFLGERGERGGERGGGEAGEGAAGGDRV